MACNCGRLSDAYRHGEASFQHVSDVPTIEERGGIAQIFSGALNGVTSPACHVSPIVGADLTVHAGHALELPLEPSHEHALLVLQGDVTLEDQPLVSSLLYYLPVGRTALTMSSQTGARVLLIGGEPFAEQILMWWNFVARTPDEIRIARQDWITGQRFGAVPAYQGPRLEAPALLHLTSAE